MKELDFAKSLADKAGDIILEHFNNTDSHLKEDGSPVTQADKRINSIVIDEVIGRFPHDSVIGEEGIHKVSGSLRTWVCDPIDGTLPYTLGIPTVVFSLALLDNNGQPLLAVVYDPFLKRMYWASKGRGAFVNNESISVNKTTHVKNSLIGNSGRSSPFVHVSQFKSYLYSECYRPIIMHSVIYEAMLVASGAIAATILTGSGEHDAASAKLIVEEAGGAVTDLFGNGQRYDRSITGAIISNGHVHEEIVNLAKKYAITKS